MLDVLRAYLEKAAPVSEDEFGFMKTIFLEKHLAKGEFFLREGEVARYGAFVVKGFLRSYVIDNKGKEHIMQFAPENWWISDKTGLTSNTSSTFFIDAIEDSDLLICDLNGHKSMMEKVPAYFSSFQAGIQKRAEA